MTLEYAIKLEPVLIVPAYTWIGLQKRYDWVTAYHNAQKQLKKFNLTPAKQAEILKAYAK